MADAALERAPAPLRVDVAPPVGEDRGAGAAASAPSTPMLSASPAAGRSGMGASARGITKKVVNELKSVRRKAVGGSSASASASVPPTPVQAAESAAVAPPPLALSQEEDTALDALAPVGSPAQPPLLSPVADAEGAAIGAAHASGKSKGCSICERAFTVFRPKHTCKMCAQKICDDCSRNRMKLNRRLERKKGSRLCDPCARNYIQTPTGTPALSPEPSPALSPRARELQAQFPLAGGAAGPFQLPRRHSVPAQSLAEFVNAKRLNGAPAAAINQVQEAASTADKPHRPSLARRKSVGERARPQSHLRRRHWISLGVLAFLLLLRVFLTRSIDGSAPDPTNSTDSTGVPTQSIVLRGVDSLLSLRILGAYVVALIAFDEVRRSRRKSRAVGQKPPVRRTARRGSSTSDLLPLARSASIGSARGRAESGYVAIQQPRMSSASPRTSQEDDELLQVDTGDQVDEQKDDDRILDNLVGTLEEAARSRAPDGALQLGIYLKTCDLICTFIQVFGRATSFAGSTVSAYLSSIETNLAAWPSPPPPAMVWKDVSVKFVIEREVELKVANVGGKKKPSSSRCLLRLLWFLEFVEACIEHGLLASQDENCAPGAGKAYEETIGKRHPWLIRKGVMSALSAIPSRSSILASLNISDGGSEEQLADLRRTQVLLKQVADELNAVFTEHDLLDLK